MSNSQRQIYPRVGFAWSGASSRSIFYIGFLEVLKENNFPIDYIASMSGSSIVAASYASGTMEQLKQAALKFNSEFVFSLIRRSKNKGGIYNMEKVEQYLRVYTQNKSFEDVKPRLGIIATDLQEGTAVNLEVGDLAKAICTSCALPGIFEPVSWGDKSLLDGGIVSVVPGDIARSSGVDLVIGVDMRGTRHVFSPWQIFLKKVFNTIKAILWPNALASFWQQGLKHLNGRNIFDEYSNLDYDLDYRTDRPGIFAVLGRALDIAITAQQNSQQDSDFDCDLLIVPDNPKISFLKKYLFFHFTDFSKTQFYYKHGRQTAQKYLPQMWQLLAEKQKELSIRDTKLKQLLVD
ncbi:MAG: patatin-like phospholipase family protein [Candidatus Doudnabacteria bacterium]